jgi:hypothetical protein
LMDGIRVMLLLICHFSFKGEMVDHRMSGLSRYQFMQ